MNYFKYIDFHNVSEARFILSKALREKYPKDFVEELETKIQGYEDHVEREGMVIG